MASCFKIIPSSSALLTFFSSGANLETASNCKRRSPSGPRSSAPNQFAARVCYDRWGNRTIHQTNTWGLGINKKDFTVNTANNRLGVPGGQSGVMTYDNAGNLITDTYTGAGSRVYNAENRMTKAWGGNNQWQEYVYNADGQRARRKIDGVERWQIYGMDGELLAEYAASGATSSPHKEYGYRNGQLLIMASSGGTSVSTATWSTLTNGIDLGGGSVRKTSPDSADWWDCTATAQQQIVGSGYFEATPASAGKQGFAIVGSNGNERTIYIGTGSWVGIYENGAEVLATYGYPTSPGTHLAGDRYRIEIEGAIVTYVRYRSGVRSVMYVSTAAAPPQPVTMKLGMAYQNAEWQNAVISNGTSSLNWLVSDHLGTPRIILDKSGSLANVKRHDYLPFGEELGAGTGGRTTGQGYTGDNVRQKFTLKERDLETGLDYFLAGYYSSTQGRFTSPDEFSGGPDELYSFAEDASENPTFYAELDNPQSLNKYQYTYNNPVNMTDEDGHCPICAAVFEVAGTVVDVVTTVRTLRDPNASTAERVVTVVGTVAGLALPGGGYAPVGKALTKQLVKREVKREAKEAVAKTADNFADAAKIPAEQRVKPPGAKQREEVYNKNKEKNQGKLKCDMCGTEMERAKKDQRGVTPKPNSATVDHIKPRSRGGTNDPGNLRGTCRKCNRDKSDND